MELIQQLVQRLNIDEEQAQGGAGLIFKMAQEKLGDGEFAHLVNAIPAITNLIGAAPQGGSGLAGMIGGFAGAMGASGDLANLAALAGGFSQLGLNPGIVSKFVPIILSFVQNRGGDEIKDILASVLK